MIFQFNETLLNTSTHGGLTPMEAMQYVTIDSCKTVMHQSETWTIIMGVLFLAAWTAFCYVLYKYLILRKK